MMAVIYSHLFADPTASRNQLPLYWHYPHYSYQGGKPGISHYEW